MEKVQPQISNTKEAKGTHFTVPNIAVCSVVDHI